LKGGFEKKQDLGFLSSKSVYLTSRRDWNGAEIVLPLAIGTTILSTITVIYAPKVIKMLNAVVTKIVTR